MCSNEWLPLLFKYFQKAGRNSKERNSIAFKDSKVYCSKVIAIVVVLWDIQVEQQLKCCYISSGDKRA